MRKLLYFWADCLIWIHTYVMPILTFIRRSLREYFEPDDRLWKKVKK